MKSCTFWCPVIRARKLKAAYQKGDLTGSRGIGGNEGIHKETESEGHSPIYTRESGHGEPAEKSVEAGAGIGLGQSGGRDVQENVSGG